ncbi:MAG: hypothetical protein QW590_01360 [Candidatus Bilamarchaeaceae archaeon]
MHYKVMKIKLISNPLKRWTKKLVRELKRLLLAAGHRVVKKGADVTICIGGDGTILYANHMKQLDGAVLGIGSKRSYMCQLRRDNWRRELLKKLKEKTDKVQVLEYTTKKKKATAVNDVVIHSNDYRVLGLRLKIGKKHFYFLGDGLIISSAIGSASYAYSAGGRKLSHRSRIIQAVPIAPYRRAFKPISISENEDVVVSADRHCALIVDGIHIKELKPNETVIIRKDGYLDFFKGVGWYEKG